MFDQCVALVQSADPAKRREAIIGFGKLGDPRALKYLAQVYRTDADPALRELAAKAGRHIQKLQQSGQSAAPPSAPPAALVPADPPSGPPGNIPDILARYTKPGGMPVRGAGGGAATPPFTADDDPLAGIGDDAPVAPPPGNLPGILAGYTTPGAGAAAGAGMVGIMGGAAPGVESATAVAGPAGPAGPAAPGKTAEPAPTDGADRAEQAVTPQNKERAARDLRTAYSYKTRGDDANAIVFLGKAFRANPELRRESAAINLAVALVGGAGRDAVNAILEKSGEPQADRPKAKGFDPELIDVLIAVLILFVIIALFNVATTYGTLIIAQALVPMLFQGMPAEYSSAGLRALFESMSLQSLLPDILKGSFVTIVATFFQTMIVYITGNLMGGAGNFLRFARVMINIQIIFYVLLALFLGLMTAGLASSSAETFATLVRVGAIGLGATVVGALFVQAWLAGRVQEFGFWKGLGSVIVGSILAGIIAGALGMFGSPSSASDIHMPDFGMPDLEYPTPGADFGM